MKFKTHLIEKDLIVAGAGMGGICTAIQAARHGLKVALINNRGVVGGNAGPEIRVAIRGGDGAGEFNFYARESGILEEIRLENLHRNPQGNAYLWHTVLLDFILREKNIQLFLDTNIDEVEVDNNGKIQWIAGSQSGSEKRFKFISSYFVDSTGDGTIGYLAGAEYRYGREARDEFGESIAPEVEDDQVLLSTLSFYSRNTGRKAPFTLPDFAKDMSLTEALKYRSIPDKDENNTRFESYRMQWFYEVGHGKDQIKDSQEILHEHRKLIYNIWNHIKTDEKYDSECYDFEYISSIPGKRESRRLMGDYILTENDIMEQKDFDDAIGYGGWAMDLHATEGFFSTDMTTRHFVLNGIYSIPFRCCYSKNVDNLLIASRCISTTHVAFGSTRVMGTLATIGQSIGTVAYLCKKYNVTPREIYKTYLNELKQLLVRNDQYILGTANEHKENLIKDGEITVSSEEKLEIVDVNFEKQLNEDCALILPVKNNIEEISLLVKGNTNTQIEYKVFTSKKKENYKPEILLKEGNIEIDKSEEFNWVKLDLGCKTTTGKIFIEFKANKDVSLAMSDDKINGVLTLDKVRLGEESTLVSVQTKEKRKYLWHRTKGIPCIKLSSVEHIYEGGNIVNGYSRNYGLPNIWLSDKEDKEPSINVVWDSPVTINHIKLVFDSDLNYFYDNLEIYHDFNAMPEIVKDYSIYAKVNDKFECIAKIKDNYQRVNQLDIDTVKTNELKIVFEKTNGADRVGVYEVVASKK